MLDYYTPMMHSCVVPWCGDTMNDIDDPLAIKLLAEPKLEIYIALARFQHEHSHSNSKAAVRCILQTTSISLSEII